MHHRRSALVALCVVLALVVTGCIGAVASSPRNDSEPPPPEGPPPKSVQRVPVVDDPAKPRAWEPSSLWATHPELLRGSERFRQLSRKGEPTPGEPTNVVLITTDDMTASDLRWMPKTRALIGGAGTRFSDSISPHPLCCPARAQMLTGQFAHNNGVRSNHWPSGGYYAMDSSNTLPVWLQRAGYQTVFMGKFLNEYGHRGPTEVPPGWDTWIATVKHVYDFFSFVTNTDGTLVRHDGTSQTEFYADRTEQLIPELAAKDQPFFLWQSHVAPHKACPHWVSWNETSCWLPPTPDIRYRGVYDDVRPPQLSDPSYNERDVSDKPRHISRKGRLSPSKRTWLTEMFQRRIESLQSVDDAVARTVDSLEAAGELDNTLLMFTSDNGYQLGEHRYDGKILPYEPSLRVPLLIRGPSVPAGVVRPATTGTLDLAPTTLAAAGARAGLPVDGRNLLPVAQGRRPGWETVLVQGGPHGKYQDQEWFYRGVRTRRYTYAEYPRTGEVELYDRRRDPHELRNAAGKPAYAATQAELQRRLRALEDCVGAQCRQIFGPVPGPGR